MQSVSAEVYEKQGQCAWAWNASKQERESVGLWRVANCLHKAEVCPEGDKMGQEPYEYWLYEELYAEFQAFWRNSVLAFIWNFEFELKLNFY